MRICVCIKQVPNSWSDKELLPESHLLNRVDADRIINEADEYAIEEALRQVEHHGGDVTIVTMGPDYAIDSLRKALSLGAHHAVLITDSALEGSDALATSLVLASYIATQDFDLVIFGATSSDAGMGVIPSMVATRLDWPALTLAMNLSIENDSVNVRRMVGSGFDDLMCALPAVVSVVDKINTPRYPNFKGILAAKKAEITVLWLSDLNVSPDKVGSRASAGQIIAVTPRPEKPLGRVIHDDGNAGEEIYRYLLTTKALP